MEAVQQRMTAEGYLALEPDGRWMELIDGVLVVNEPGVRHGVTHTQLLLAIGAWIQAAPGRGMVIAPLDVRLDEHNVYAPDLLWYAEHSAPALDDPAPHPLPELAVEIRSPSTWRHDIGVKKSVYEREGLRELWLVDTAASVVLVFRRSQAGAPAFDVALELGGADVLTSALPPGFELGAGELFERARRASPRDR